MEKLSVYDFDKTIYNGETLNDFYRFYLKEKPLKFYTIFFQSFYFLLYILRIISLERLKEKFLKFLNGIEIEELKNLIDRFWKTREKKINPWIYNEIEKNRRETDILIAISASPTFLIERKLKEIGFDVVIGTDFFITGEKFSSEIISKNCKNYEKVLRLDKWSDSKGITYKIVNFYSDSIADKPLFDIAENKFWIKNGTIIKGMPEKKTISDRIFWK